MKKKMKILHLEDLPSDAELVERELKKANIFFDKMVVDNKTDFICALNDFAPDVILCDHTIPAFDSMEALQLVKQSGREIPFILATGTVSEEYAVNIMREGADDYVLKDRLQRLPSALINVLEKYKLKNERENFVSSIIASEHQLKAAHERLVFHLENSPLGFIEWNNEGIVKSWSKRAKEIFGWSDIEILNNTRINFNIVHADDLEVAQKTAGELLAGAVSRNTCQTRNYTKEGKLIWCEWFNSALKDEQGNVLTILSLVQDITSRRKAEETLKQSESRFRKLFENAPAAILLLDLEHGAFSRYNNNALQLLKYTEQELLTKSFEDICPPLQANGQATAEKITADIQTAVSEEKSVFEWAIRDAQQKDLTCYVRLVKFSDGNKNEILASLVDISERKQAEAIREKITADLIQRNKDLEQFTYIVSHNLRAPVANIIGLLNMFDETDINTQTHDKIKQNLVLSAEKLDDIIRDLNQILQVRTKLNEQRKIVKFSDLLNDIKASISNVLEKEDVIIIADFFEVQELFTLKNYLYSIFYNLISNSIKFRQPDTRPVIEIKSRIERDRILLVFKDNGIGIDLKKQGDQVFGLYKRFHLHVEGKGFGLFMVKTEVEILGGSIHVASGVNKGTIFTISFPYQE